MSLSIIKQTVKTLSSQTRANLMKRFFKTGVGQYGQGDIFVGLTNPQCRQIAKENSNIQLKQVQKLLSSHIHQERFIALVILIDKFKKLQNKQQIYQLYLKNTKYINNWDLVDCSAYHIVGQYLSKKQDRSILYKFVSSQSLWERRIAIISTFTFIKNNQFRDTLKISQRLLQDQHDLIHKAVGWMLRQVGKRCQKTLQTFIKQNYDQIPRTALRYSIEKFNQAKRKQYLRKQF